jgi:oligopeptidase A
MNPLVDLSFDIPFDSIRAEHVRPAMKVLLDRAREAIEEIAAQPEEPTYASTMDALEAATEPLERAMTVVGHLESVVSSPELREAYNAVVPEVSAFFASLPLHEGLWRVINRLAATDEAKKLSATKKRFLEKTLDDFRRHGAELSPEEKERLQAITRELAELTSRFSQNVLDATAAFELILEDEKQLAGLPPSAIEAAREAAREKGIDGWRFTLHAPSYIPLMTYLDDASLREKVWRAYDTRASYGPHDNRHLVRRILELRQEKARLLGFTDFSDLVLADRMAENGERASDFVRRLRERTEPHFHRENEELRKFRASRGDDGPMQPWDVTYWAEKQRRALFEFDEEELRPYFPLDRVVEGMFDIVSRLYGIRIVEREGLPVWHPSVRTFEILDEEGSLLCRFYADLFPRDEKRGGAWMNGLVTGVYSDGAKTPHLGLICANFTPPSATRPALLTHREVETLFHEFGHLLHHALSEVEVRSLGGTNVAWDFVELPSQIMENWCWEREALDLFARHYETGARIPDELFERLSRTRTYRAANAMMRQLGFARVDLDLHREWTPEKGDVFDFARAILQEHAPAPLPRESAMIASFNHLFSHEVGYAAGYYSYKWAEVLDADAFGRFREEGVFNPEVGRAFRREILSKGDSRKPSDLFRAFRGRDPSLDPLFRRAGLA